MIRPDPSIPNNRDVLPEVRDYLARYRECRRDAHHLAQVLGLPEAEVQAALEALTIEDELLP